MDTHITLNSSKLLLTNNEGSAKDTVVLFLPGISGKAHSKRFQPLVDITLGAGLPIARLDAWSGEESLQDKTYTQMQQLVTQAIEHLASLGYVQIIGVGKSFGGGLLLSMHNEALTKKILWAPAIGFGMESALYATKLKEIADLKTIQVSPEFVRADAAKIYIVHGTADTAFPIETSREFIAHATAGQLVEVAGADHSFKAPESEAALLQATLNFLQN